MSASDPRKIAETTLAQDLGAFARYWLRDRRVQIALAVAVVGVGAALNWSWLAAIGVAPLLLSFAPCAAMCALGLCLTGRGGKRSCGKGDAEAASGPEGPIGLRSDRAVTPDAAISPAPPQEREREPEALVSAQAAEALPAEPSDGRQVAAISKGGER